MGYKFVYKFQFFPAVPAVSCMNFSGLNAIEMDGYDEHEATIRISMAIANYSCDSYKNPRNMPQDSCSRVGGYMHENRLPELQGIGEVCCTINQPSHLSSVISSLCASMRLGSSSHFRLRTNLESGIMQ